jgi:hypothetical protein
MAVDYMQAAWMHRYLEAAKRCPIVQVPLILRFPKSDIRLLPLLAEIGLFITA